MIILGLTGSIGCGKSSVSNILKDNNIDIIDADLISRNILNDKNLLNLVFERFGDSVKNVDGSLNRKALGNIVFNDDNKLIELNSLTHPRIKENIINEIEVLKLRNKEVIVIDAPLLIEGGYFILTDYFSLSDDEEQMHRQNLIKLKIEQGIIDEEFYHYDTPLTVKHETEALFEAGFSSVEVLSAWGATYTLKAIK